MDIYILRDGKEIGPFSEETTQSLLKQGNVLISDLAWRPGMAQWIPLHSVLYPPPETAKPPPPGAAVVDGAADQPATERQKAFLSYLGIHFPSNATKAEAALLVNDAMEEQKDPGRLARWNEDRLRLHPELFVSEIQAKKENRATRFLEIVQTRGAEFFTGVTKAHCQVLVGYLDVRFPNWDNRDEDVASNHFFPAIAEKFPQLVTKQGKGKFKYPQGPRVAPELTNRGGMPHVQHRRSRLAAIVRGIGVGTGILLVLFAGHKYYTTKSTRAGIPAGSDENAILSGVPAGPTDRARVSTAAASPPDGGLSETSSSGTAMSTTNAEPPTPAEGPVAASPPEATPVFDPAPPGTPAEPPVPPPKTDLVLTKPTEVQLPYGPAILPAGTAVKLVSREGAMLRVRYKSDLLQIPASSTDLVRESSPAAVPPPGSATTAPARPATPAPAATPVPRMPESLF